MSNVSANAKVIVPNQERNRYSLIAQLMFVPN